MSTLLILLLIFRYKVTALTLVPSIVYQLVNSPKAKKADLSSLSVVNTGAAYLPDQLAVKLKAIGPQSVIMTEGVYKESDSRV